MMSEASRGSRRKGEEWLYWTFFFALGAGGKIGAQFW
jgi:hypothetical protein